LPQNEYLQDSKEMNSLKSEILRYWSPAEDPRAHYFLEKPIHKGPSFFKILLKLAPHCSYEDFTRMVNSRTIERVRHGYPKEHHHIREDVWEVREICRKVGFQPTHPEAIEPDGLRFFETG
jgi:hypothetical protein